MRQLPITTKIADVDVTPVFGQPLFRLFSQTMRILEREPGGSALKNFFAEPSVSEIEQVIYWRTQVAGEIRSFAAFSETERLAGARQVESYCQRVQTICESVAKVQGPRSPTVEALKRMLVTPSIEASLFLVGTQFVLTQWGCRPYGRAPSDFALEVQGKTAAKRLVTPSPAPEVTPPVQAVVPPEVIQASAPASIPPPQSIPPVPPAVDPLPEEPGVEEPPPEEPIPDPVEPPKEESPPERKPFFWRWLLLLSLLLLLLLGLFLKEWTYVAPHDVAAERQHRAEIAELWLKMDEKSKTCKPVVPPKAEPQEPQGLSPEALERKDLNVFNGDWKLITELTSSRTGELILINFSFDARGSGTATILEKGGNVCSGGVSLDIKSANSFNVDMSRLQCKDGTAYNKNFAQCVVRKGNKLADCVMKCQNGSCDAVFERR